MATIYVAGPVSRPGRSEMPEWVTRCYKAARDIAQETQLDLNVLIPAGDASLDTAAPKDFHRQIAGRISSASAVITIETPEDTATAAESCLASAYEKKQLILTADEKKVPRILRGQPGVIGVVECTEWNDPAFAIRQFIQRLA